MSGATATERTLFEMLQRTADTHHHGFSAKLRRSLGLSTCRSVGRMLDGRSACRSVGDSIGRSDRQSLMKTNVRRHDYRRNLNRRATYKSKTETCLSRVSQLVGRSVGQTVRRSMGLSFDRSVDRSINRSISKTTVNKVRRTAADECMNCCCRCVRSASVHRPTDQPRPTGYPVQQPPDRRSDRSVNNEPCMRKLDAWPCPVHSSN